MGPEGARADQDLIPANVGSRGITARILHGIAPARHPMGAPPQCSAVSVLSRPWQLEDQRPDLRSNIIESRLPAGIKNDLLAPDVMAEVRRHVHQVVRDKARTSPDKQERLQSVEREVANLTDCIASGALRVRGDCRTARS